MSLRNSRPGTREHFGARNTDLEAGRNRLLRSETVPRQFLVDLNCHNIAFGTVMGPSPAKKGANQQGVACILPEPDRLAHTPSPKILYQGLLGGELVTSMPALTDDVHNWGGPKSFSDIG